MVTDMALPDMGGGDGEAFEKDQGDLKKKGQRLHSLTVRAGQGDVFKYAS